MAEIFAFSPRADSPRGKEQAKKPLTEVKHPRDIKKLGWKGNFAQDQERFKAVDNYVKNEKDPKKQKLAARLDSLHGMGEKTKGPTSDADLKAYLDGIHDWP